jgi:ABC-type transport system involved in multi-copper enzyme maturation permease subunit
MLRLMAREVLDNGVLIGACCVISAIIITIVIFKVVSDVMNPGIVGAWVLMAFLLLVFGVLGVTQMYGDRGHRVSTLLATQAVTRDRILMARILTGVLTVLVTLVPALVATGVLLKSRVLHPEFYSSMALHIAAALLLAGLASHCIGLLVGWTGNKIRVSLGLVGLLAVLASLVAIKGFDASTLALLGLLILAGWARIWHTFTSTSL